MPLDKVLLHACTDQPVDLTEAARYAVFVCALTRSSLPASIWSLRTRKVYALSARLRRRALAQYARTNRSEAVPRLSHAVHG